MMKIAKLTPGMRTLLAFRAGVATPAQEAQYLSWPTSTMTRIYQQAIDLGYLVPATKAGERDTITISL